MIPPRFLEDELGQFFVQPFIGLSIIPGSLKISNLQYYPKVDHELGHSVGLVLWATLGKFDGRASFRSFLNDFSGIKESLIGSVSSLMEVDGTTEATNIGARLGYGIPYGESGWFKSSLGFGFSQRRTSFNSKSNWFSDTYVSESESVFMYDLLLAVAYELGIGWDAVLSYRFMNMDEYESFDDLSVHLFELGLGKNF